MNLFKRAVYRIIYILSPKKSILFEGFPDCSDNSRAVYDEFVRRGLDKKYNLVWQLFDGSKEDPQIEGKHIFLKKWTIKSRYYYASAKALIVCNRFLGEISPDAVYFYLTHGTPLKDTSGYYKFPQIVDYCLATSVEAATIQSKYFKFPETRIIPLGYPRNDILCNIDACVRNNIESFLGVYKKYIVWYPTFRQAVFDIKTTDCKNSLPILHDQSLANKLNECAKKNDVLIILKPHFAQDVSYIKSMELSNIRFIDDQLFKDKGISSYEFVASCDALVSDYSSIYFDYLLCDKPIGLVWEDIEEYRKKPGLVENYEEYCRGGEKIYNIDDFCQFILNVANGNDKLKEERNKLCDIFNYSRDGKNAERVTDFIIEKARL